MVATRDGEPLGNGNTKGVKKKTKNQKKHNQTKKQSQTNKPQANLPALQHG